MMKEKISNLQLLLNEQEIDTLLIGNFGHQIKDDLLYYLLLTHLELGIMFIPKEGRSTLYAIPFEVAQLQEQYPEIHVQPLDKKLNELLENYPGSIGCRPVALPATQYQTSFVPLTGEEYVIAVKLQEEIAQLREAASITDRIFSELLHAWPTFHTETDVESFIQKQCITHAVVPSFPPIIASGKNAANPHHHPTGDVLQQGFCVIDMGVRYKGYCSDMTRTIYIGSPTNDEQKIYDQILSAQEKTIQQISNQKNTSSLSEFCRAALGEKFNPYFTHSLGHGIGTQVHEWPSVSTKSDVILQPGMIITIEPGVYIPDKWGIRIEDDVLVTEHGYETLTQSPKKLLPI